MTVMGQKDWDEHLTSKQLLPPVVYTQVKDYCTTYKIKKEDLLEEEGSSAKRTGN